MSGIHVEQPPATHTRHTWQREKGSGSWARAEPKSRPPTTNKLSISQGATSDQASQTLVHTSQIMPSTTQVVTSYATANTENSISTQTAVIDNSNSVSNDCDNNPTLLTAPSPSTARVVRQDATVVTVVPQVAVVSTPNKITTSAIKASSSVAAYEAPMEEAMAKIENQKRKLSLHVRKAKVLYDFKAEYPEEIDLFKDAIVIVIAQTYEDWWYGFVGSNRSKKGYFPKKYVQLIEGNGNVN